jgi:hypothetical protein
MTRICPICGSEKIGGSPKRWKDYTPDRGRLDIDYMRCDVCRAAWDSYHYVREDVYESHDLRRGDGNRPAWGDLPPRTCTRCKGLDVKWLWSDGPWHGPETEILRYECRACGEIWQEVVNESDGKRLFRRVWRQGHDVG